MIGIGTIANVAAVLLGGGAGLLLKGGMKERYQQIIMQALGLCTLFIGLSGVLQAMLQINGDSLEASGSMLLIASLVIGSILGEWIDIDENGKVTIDGAPLEEPYLEEPALGKCDIELPYQVQDGRYFVMGDHRSVSSDSRSSQVGCVSEEQIVGKLIFRIWPLDEIGTIA